MLVLLWKYWYDYYRYERNVTIEEQNKRKIDEYNFEQLTKVKIILKDIKRSDKKFQSLKEFNHIYNADINPIKNCYYIKNYEDNNRVLYTFWFKLESKKYKDKYWLIGKYGTVYYVYPKYDLPYSKVCFWTKKSCTDLAYDHFDTIISNPCED